MPFAQQAAKTEEQIILDNGRNQVVLVIDQAQKAKIISSIGEARFNERVKLINEMLPLYLEAAAEMGFNPPTGKLVINLETKESLGKLIANADMRPAFFDEKTGVHINMEFLAFGGKKELEEQRQTFFIILCHELTHWLVSTTPGILHGWQRGSMSVRQFQRALLVFNASQKGEFFKNKPSNQKIIDELKGGLWRQSLLEGTNQILATDLAVKILSKNRLVGFGGRDKLKYETGKIYDNEQAYASLLIHAIGNDEVFSSYAKGDFSIVGNAFCKKYSISKNNFNEVVADSGKLTQFLVQHDGIGNVLDITRDKTFYGDGTSIIFYLAGINELLDLGKTIKTLDKNDARNRIAQLKAKIDDKKAKGLPPLQMEDPNANVSNLLEKSRKHDAVQRFEKHSVELPLSQPEKLSIRKAPSLNPEIVDWKIKVPPFFQEKKRGSGMFATSGEFSDFKARWLQTPQEKDQYMEMFGVVMSSMRSKEHSFSAEGQEDNKQAKELGLWLAKKIGVPENDWLLQQEFIDYFKIVMLMKNGFGLKDITYANGVLFVSFAALAPYKDEIRKIAKEYGLYFFEG